MGSNPDASGSRDPVCPALRALNRRLTRATAPAELSPTGLSSKRMPSRAAGILGSGLRTDVVAFIDDVSIIGPIVGLVAGDGLAVRLAGCGRGPRFRLVHRVDQLGQPYAMLDRSVELETQSGRIADHQRLRQSVAQKSGGTFQPSLHLRIRTVLAEDQVVDPRRAQIPRHADGRDRHIPDALVLDVAPQHLTQFALDLLSQPSRSRIVFVWHIYFYRALILTSAPARTANTF